MRGAEKADSYPRVVDIVHQCVDDGGGDGAAAFCAFDGDVGDEGVLSQGFFAVGGADEADGEADDAGRSDGYIFGEAHTNE